MPEKARFLVTPSKLVQTFADRHGVDEAELALPATAVVTPVAPLFRKLIRLLKGEPIPAWKWKSPLFHEFSLGGGEKGVIACCPVGAPNVAVAIEELAAFGVRTVYFFGLAGGIGERVSAGDLILPRYAHVGEGTTRYYGNAPLSFADGGLLATVRRALERETGHAPAACPVWSTDALYRESADIVERFARLGAGGVDMETSAVFSVAAALSVRAMALLWISDLLTPEGWSPHFHKDTLRNSIDRHLRAFATFLRKREE